MKIEQVDRHCDQFEERLRNGEKLSVEDFLREHRLPDVGQLVSELRKVEHDYLNQVPDGHVAKNPARAARQLPATEFLSSAAEATSSVADESIIGNYKLLQKIGEGGMGVVYMAEQSRPVSRRVALKIIKPGMDSQEVLARFEAERQALALMDHPNIARVFEAGTTVPGRPYFVMELVKGVPITTYCDERRLSLTERLDLFLPVCHAVQHAHQKGIIHRDIKPSNVLVAQYDNHPVPKVIDFGLAKAIGQRLTERTMFTQFGQILGTIDYMSPEQASFNQLDIDTRSDIYSLGVLLYELLVGETPFDRKRLHAAAVEEMLRIIRQDEPPRPSFRLSSSDRLPAIAANRRSEPGKLSLLVRGELDWIVMKAIDKERDRRYESASGFAEDVRRHLDGEAVWACPPSAGYRFRKFIRRNRGLFAATTTVFVALVVGLAGALVAYDAQKEKTRELMNRMSDARRTEAVAKIQNRQAKYYRRSDEKMIAFLNRLTAQVSRRHGPAEPEIGTSDRELLTELIRFWDEMIASDAEGPGDPGPREPYYRLQRALCLARRGDHKEAFNQLRDVESDVDRAKRVPSSLFPHADQTREFEWDAHRAGEWAPEFARICALCAAANNGGSAPVEPYVAQGIEYLRKAARTAIKPPPARDDVDLTPLSGHSEFVSIVELWDKNWSENLARQPEQLKVNVKRATTKRE